MTRDSTFRAVNPLLSGTQVSPPLMLLNTPCPRGGNNPRVPAYRVPGCRGSIAMEVIPAVGRGHVGSPEFRNLHVSPPFELLASAPPCTDTYNVVGFRDSTVMGVPSATGARKSMSLSPRLRLRPCSSQSRPP